MKNVRYKKVLGLALGERSLLLAEISVGVDRPSVSRLSEMPLPPGVTINQPEQVGAALGSFIQQQLIAARAVVVGLPARWIVAQTKEVPSVDDATLSNILRLQAEAEFSTELKDLVYDFAGGQGTAPANAPATVASLGVTTQSILLAATPRKYLDLVATLCTAAKLNLIAVTPSAIAIGNVSSVRTDAIVLTVSSGTAEMTAQRPSGPSTIRHLRSPTPEGPFVSELRRVVSTMPAASRREMVLWDDSGMNVASMGEQLGLPIRAADLKMLGVDASAAASNGQGRKFATAVALALGGLVPGSLAVDFAHSRLAPPKERLVPPWMIATAVVLLFLIGGTVYAFHWLGIQQADVDRMQARVDGMKSQITEASAFVDKVGFAQAWHGGDPRYLAAVRDLTAAMSDEPETFATALALREIAKPVGNAAAASKIPDTHMLSGTLNGRTSDLQHVQTLIEKMRRFKAFGDPKSGGSDLGRGREVTFSINFNYGLPDATTQSSVKK